MKRTLKQKMIWLIAIFDSVISKFFLKVIRALCFIRIFLIRFSLPQNTMFKSDEKFVRNKMRNTGRPVESYHMNPYEGLERVRTSNFAYYCEQSTARALIKKLFEPHEICDTKEIEYETFFSLGIIVKKHSPLRERLLLNWIWMFEIGIYNKIWRHWNQPMPPCSLINFKSVRLEYDAPIFIFLAAAYIVSFGILIFELIYSWLTKRKTEAKNR